jgi:uncharacterized YigZ family protein
LNDYKTVSKQATAEITEKKSRFIANVCPISAEQQGLDFLQSVRSKYYDARHNVFAYVLRQNNIQRYSDDGEPSGTAGMPTLDVIRKEGLTDLLVVVTRYFGGILLGTGGLVRAYTKAAKEGIEAAGIITRRFCRQYSIQVDYTLLGKVQHEAAQMDCIPGEILYTDQVTLTYYVPETELRFEGALVNCTNGRIQIKQGEGKYIDVD